MFAVGVFQPAECVRVLCALLFFRRPNLSKTLAELGVVDGDELSIIDANYSFPLIGAVSFL